MAYFTTLTATLLAPAAEDTTPDGVEVYKIKCANSASSPGIPTLLMVDKDTENGSFLKALSDKTSDAACRVLVTGVLQLTPAVKDDDGGITKAPYVTVYVGAARRIRADVQKDPEQAVVMGSGFCFPVTDYEDKTKRKAELFLSSGTESFQESGKYSSQVHLVTDPSAAYVGELFSEVPEGTEVYFQGNLFRSKGEMNGTAYDKLKVSATFAQNTERVRERGGGGKKSKVQSMRSQLNDSFEEDESVTTTMSATQLAQQASVSLADFDI